MVIANDFNGNDNEKIEQAIAARGMDGIVIISPRNAGDGRNFWLLDKAILLPENTTIILRNCKIKLSDKCRDNFFRTANCGLGIPDPAKTSNIHIKGEGLCVLEGAEHPRATGDGGKMLSRNCPYRSEDEVFDFESQHGKSFGTDAGVGGESQYGDWRNIGILFANTENFSITNIILKDYHGWGVSLEACASGKITNISFDACMSKSIDGTLMNIENQDGIDIRNGCHDIIVSDIFGHTGDDVIALTAYAGKEFKPGGSMRTTQVMPNDWTKRESGIRDIIIRNVVAHSHLCYTIRILSIETKITDIIVSGVIDTSPKIRKHGGTIVIGEPDGIFGNNLRDGVSDILISDIISNSRYAVKVKGYLKDSAFCNVINAKDRNAVFSVDREEGFINVRIQN